VISVEKVRQVIDNMPLRELERRRLTLDEEAIILSRKILTSENESALSASQQYRPKFSSLCHQSGDNNCKTMQPTSTNSLSLSEKKIWE